VIANRGKVLREKGYLNHQYAAIFSSVGMILPIAGTVMLIPLLTLLVHPDQTAHAPALVCPAPKAEAINSYRKSEDRRVWS